MATVVEWLAFGEQITAGTVLGIIGLVIAYVLTDNNTWKIVSERIRKKRTMEEMYF